MDYAPLLAGALRAHSLRKPSRLVLETADGRPVIGFTHGSDPYSASLEAADGTWSMHGVDVSSWSGPASWSVTDARGTEVGTLGTGRAERSMTLPAGPATWSYHAIHSPHYQVDGLFSANRTALHRLAPGITRRPFSVEVTDALIARSDASLLLLLATSCTNNHIVSKVQAAGD